MRAFFAVEPGEPARAAAADAATWLRERPHADGVRWTRPESLHVTLRFLGEIDAGELPAMTDRVRGEVAGETPFELCLDGVDAFPSRRRPRVLVLGITPREPAERLAAAVERGVVASGWPAEERAFHPHLTLGRVRRGRRAPALDGAPPPPPARIPVREVVLFESRLGRGGSTYVPLERLALGNDSNSATNSSQTSQIQEDRNHGR